MAFSSNTANSNTWWTQEKIMNWQRENACEVMSDTVAGLSVDPEVSTLTLQKAVSGDTSHLSQVNKELKLERKEERLRNLEEKLEQEKKMLSIGRDQLNRDIQRHQFLMRAAINDLNEQVALERKRFIEEMTKELERFKLPSVKLMQAETGRVSALISTAKKIYGEEFGAFVWNLESDADKEKMEG